MKSFRLPITWMLFPGMIFLASCGNDEVLPAPAADGQLMPRNRDHCDSLCIDPADPVYHVHAFLVAETNDIKVQRLFNIGVHNTLATFEVRWRYSDLWTPSNARRRLHFHINSPDVGEEGWYAEYVTPPLHAGDSGTYGFELPEGWSACDPVVYSVVIEDEGGNPKSRESIRTYPLIGECLE